MNFSNRILATLLFVCVFCARSFALEVNDLRCEYRTNPLGLDAAKPRLSWTLSSDRRGEIQTSYQVAVASSESLLAADKGDLWDSGKVSSCQSTQLEYGGNKLVSNQACFWKVRVWDADGKPSKWSTPSSWSMGLLPKDWKASWIGDDPPGLDHIDSPFAKSRWIWFHDAGYPSREDRWFRKEFDLPVGVAIKSAKVHFTADNVFELFVNGKSAAAGSDWTLPVAADITKLLTPGHNLLAVKATNTDPSPAGILGDLTIELENGNIVSIPTDSSWVSLDKEVKDWNLETTPPTGWTPVLDIGGYGTLPWGALKIKDKIYWPATYLRKDFTLTRLPARAYYYVTSLGEVEPHLNGQKVGEDFFLPGWTDYHKRVYYRTYDVTHQLKVGANALGAILGDGWFRGNVSILGQNIYGRKTRLLAQLQLIYPDGSTEVIASDPSWNGGSGPVLQTDHYDGEKYDARLEIPGWDQPGYKNPSWHPVQTGAELTPAVLAAPSVPVQATGEIKVVAMTEPKPGLKVFNLGQNFAGWARLKVSAPAGTKIVMRFGEILNPDGTVYRANLRSAQATDTYICKGDHTETWEPQFTYHGFQYVEVEGLPVNAGRDTLTGIIVGSNVPPVGSFACSNDMLNRIMTNMRWSLRSNIVDVPTDCPQRDERMGWMDFSEFAPSALYDFDASSVVVKWVADVMDAQGPNHVFSLISPDPHNFAWSAGWGDSGVLIPWLMFQTYGDTQLAGRYYADLAGYLEYYKSRSPGNISPDEGFGDWIALDDSTPKNLISTAQFARCAQAMSELAQALGKKQDAASYGQLWQNIRQAFQKKFINPDGTIGTDSQGGYAMALGFDLLDSKQIAQVTPHFVAAIEKRGGHVSTGMVTTHLLLPALTKGGRSDIAYELLGQKTFPSWGYFLKEGATTMWEHWDSKTEQGLSSPGMNSFNHASLGACSEWFYSTILGINQSAPGYEKILIEPQPGGGLTWAKGYYDSLRGRIVSSWKIDGDQFTLDVTIPVGSTATVHVPGTTEKSAGAKFLYKQNQESVFTIGSGTYQFQSKFSPSSARL